METAKIETTKVSDKLSTTNITNLSNEQIAVIQQTVAKDCNPTELAYFLGVAKSYSLDPFKKEIWCYKDHKGNVVIFAGRDGFLAIASKNQLYRGVYSQAVYKNDIFEGDLNKPDTIIHKVNSFERGALLGAYAIVRMEGCEPLLKMVKLDQYKRNSPTWNSYPDAMICKVAESSALKIACGITGISVGEEEVKETWSVAELALLIEGAETIEELENIEQKHKLQISKSVNLTKELFEAKQKFA